MRTFTCKWFLDEKSRNHQSHWDPLGTHHVSPAVKIAQTNNINIHPVLLSGFETNRTPVFTTFFINSWDTSCSAVRPVNFDLLQVWVESVQGVNQDTHPSISFTLSLGANAVFSTAQTLFSHCRDNRWYQSSVQRVLLFLFVPAHRDIAEA